MPSAPLQVTGGPLTWLSVTRGCVSRHDRVIQLSVGRLPVFVPADLARSGNVCERRIVVAIEGKSRPNHTAGWPVLAACPLSRRELPRATQMRQCPEPRRLASFVWTDDADHPAVYVHVARRR